MLQKLTIENAVLIKNAQLDFSRGLNILSGETGAGKSILIDCLMLLFGSRYDRNFLRYGAQSGFVEGVFTLNDATKKQMEELGFEEDDLAIISRRFNADGKNEIRINGRICTVSMLKSLMSGMVDIYGQNDYQYYADKNAQLKILDYYVNRTEQQAESGENLFSLISDEWRQFKKIKAELTELGEALERGKNIDFLKYQIKEIEDSAVFNYEEDELVANRRIAQNSAKIIEMINESVENIAKNQFSQALHALNKLSSYYGGDEKDEKSQTATNVPDELVKRLESVMIEVDDIQNTLAKMLDKHEFDNNYLDKLENRLVQVRAIKRKYGDFDAMSKFLLESKKRLEKLENCDELFEKLSFKKEKSLEKLYEMSMKLSAIRKNRALSLEKNIENELRQLGMETAVFKIQFSDLPPLSESENRLSAKGFDDIEFYLSTNAGQPLKPFLKIVSGGEMSRFMLALKVVTGDMDKIPTLIFDEIDSGISGRVGQEVAKKLAQIAMNHQTLCVTHLPQIAAMADTHFFVNKSYKDGDTATQIKRLDRQGMVNEISRLCGSVGISGKSEDNASEIKAWSDGFKSTLTD